MPTDCDLAVVGGGIVGLATAREFLARRPNARVRVLEKERAVGLHQTGHSSGVVHSGIYYRPGSLKARLCVEGRRALLAYAEERGIRHALPGKLIVATRPLELPRLNDLERRAAANGVEQVRRLDPTQLRELEPEARGLAALEVPGTGIIDYPAVARAYAEDIERAGGTVDLGAAVVRASAGSEEMTLSTGDGSPVTARFLVNCAGLYADRLARGCGASLPARIVPFRGEFYRLGAAWRPRVRRLLYPVPDPRLPFVGVHVTPRVDGEVEVGPNAVLALAREGYGRWDWTAAEVAELALFPGFWRMARRFADTGVREAYRSLDRGAFARDLARIVPGLSREDLLPADAGVRAQPVAPDGSLLDDFVLVPSPRALHVIGAPSPAATSSLALAREIVARIPADR